MSHTVQAVPTSTYLTPPASSPMSIPEACGEPHPAGNGVFHVHTGRFYEPSYINELRHMSPDRLYRDGRTSISGAGNAYESETQAEIEAKIKAKMFMTRKLQEKFVAMLQNESLEELVLAAASPPESSASGKSSSESYMATTPISIPPSNTPQSMDWEDDKKDVIVQSYELGRRSDAVVALWVENYHRSLCMYHARWLLDRESKR